MQPHRYICFRLIALMYVPSAEFGPAIHSRNQGKSWHCRFRYNGAEYHLGCHSTERQAAEALSWYFLANLLCEFRASCHGQKVWSAHTAAICHPSKTS